MEHLSASDAAQALSRAATYEGALRQRTEGINLMLWGIVTSAVFVSYAFADVLGAGELTFSTLWLPWIALGTVASAAVWRSAALSAPKPMLGAPSRWLLRVVGLSLAMGGAFALLQPEGPNLPLAITGGAWVLLGATNLFRSSQYGRLLWATCGLVLLLASAALELTDARIEVAGTLAIALPAAAAVTSGAWQTFRA